LDALKRVDRCNLKRFQPPLERASTVHIVLPGAGPPDPAARDAFNALNNKWGHTVASAAVVIERGGFLGVAVRSAVAGMVMVAPKHFRVKVFDAIDPVVPWLVEHHLRATGVQWIVDDVLAVLRSARSTAG
jgi:hypothetical protein